MKCGINKIVLNESQTDSDKFKNFISALSNKEIIVEKGGFLFSAVIIVDIFHIGILPYFENGQRSYHYNIQLPTEKHILTGFINSNTTIDIIFKLTKDEMQNGIDEELLAYYREVIIKFSNVFIEHGFSEDIALGPMTLNIFQETKLFPVMPHNLKQIAECPIG